jgi:lysophospholipase L1-like esterase
VPGPGSAWSVAGKLLLLAGGLILGLLAAEGIVRVVAPQHPTLAFVLDPPHDPLHQLDPAVGMVLKPNVAVPFVFGTHVRTNSLGLREGEIGPKRPGELRILSLGDSYAMGYGVELEQSYGKLVERELGRRYPDRTFSVISAGVDGYGTEQMRRTYLRLRGRLQPDFVLATFVAGNDVDDNAMFERRLRTHLNRPLGALAQHSQLAQLLLRVTFPAWFFLGNRDEGGIAHTIDLLRELEATFRASNVPYLMLVIPARHQIRPELEPAVKLLLRAGLGDLVFRQNREIIDHFTRDGIPFIDLLPPLVAADREARVSFVKDSHLNAFGHAVVARAILPRLQSMLALSGQAATLPRRSRP